MKFLSKLLFILVISQADRRSLVRLRLRLLKIEENFKIKDKESNNFLDAIVEVFHATHKWYSEDKFKQYKKFLKYISWINRKEINNIIATIERIDTQLDAFYSGPYFSLRMKNYNNEINDASVHFGDKARGKSIIYYKNLACKDRYVNRKIVEVTRKLSNVLIPEIEKLTELIKM